MPPHNLSAHLPSFPGMSVPGAKDRARKPRTCLACHLPASLRPLPACLRPSGQPPNPPIQQGPKYVPRKKQQQQNYQPLIRRMCTHKWQNSRPMPILRLNCLLEKKGKKKKQVQSRYSSTMVHSAMDCLTSFRRQFYPCLKDNLLEK